MAERFAPIDANNVWALMEKISEVCDGYTMSEACMAFNQFVMHQALDAAKERRLKENIVDE